MKIISSEPASTEKYTTLYMIKNYILCIYIIGVEPPSADFSSDIEPY